MVSAIKIFLEKPLSAEKLKLKIDSGKLAPKYLFMKTKMFNTEVWVILEDRINIARNVSYKRLCAASNWQIVEAASELTKCLVSSKHNEQDAMVAKVPLTMLKNAYLLLENWTKLTITLEEVLSNHRCPLKYTRLIDIADDASKHLSGDSITDALESLHKESNMKEQLKKGPDLLFCSTGQTTRPLPRPREKQRIKDTL